MRVGNICACKRPTRTCKIGLIGQGQKSVCKPSSTLTLLAEDEALIRCAENTNNSSAWSMNELQQPGQIHNTRSQLFLTLQWMASKSPFRTQCLHLLQSLLGSRAVRQGSTSRGEIDRFYSGSGHMGAAPAPGNPLHQQVDERLTALPPWRFCSSRSLNPITFFHRLVIRVYRDNGDIIKRLFRS